MYVNIDLAVVACKLFGKLLSALKNNKHRVFKQWKNAGAI